jgi:predicted ATPase
MAEYSLQRGHLLTAQAEAQRLLQINPLHEEGNQLVIAALAGMGQTGQALAHYEHFRRMLQRELDVTPAVETDRLAAAVRAGEMPIYGVSPLPAYAGPPLAVNPAGLEMLIGRTVEANELNAWLNDPNRRLITITGMGGVGKTRLALAVAQEQSRVFRAGVVYVPLVDVPDPAQFPAALCAAVTGRTQNDYPSLVQVAAHIGKGDLLLVLDHFDHLLEARRDLTYLLHTCPNLVVLLTSRQRLGLAAEWVFRLGGLDTPPAGMESSLADYSAAALFLHSVQQARPDLVLDSETATAVGEICRLVQGLPLALVLLAAWVRVLPCTELLQELQRSIDVVRSTRPAADDKEISLRSVLEQSWRSLRSEERAVLAGLSVFQGGFDRHAATAVAGADLDVLCCLVDHSLLQVSPEGRYSWHELVQQFCAEHLALEQQTAAASSRHFAYFLAQAEDHAAKLSAMNNLAAFLWFGCERANLEAAIVWAGSRQDLIAPGDCQRLLAVIEQAGHRKGVHNTRLDA